MLLLQSKTNSRVTWLEQLILLEHAHSMILGMRINPPAVQAMLSKSHALLRMTAGF